MPPPSRGGALRARLRDSTRPLHDRVEATDMMGALLRDDLTADAYAGTLRALASIYAPLEAALTDVAGLRDALPDLDDRFKTVSLARDLSALGREDVAAADPAEPPWPRDVPSALGVLYVLEGSTMGARLIARALRTRPFVNADALHFFEHYGDRAAEFWQRFLGALENVTDADHDATVAAALATFQIFIDAADRRTAAQP